MSSLISRLFYRKMLNKNIYRLRPVTYYSTDTHATTTETHSQTETHSHTTTSGSETLESVTEQIRTSPTPEELQDEEQWMQEEIKAYYRSKNILAKMMGKEPDTFTEKDVKESIEYLLPSSLFDKTARPFLKHPSKVFPKRRQAEFDSSGRPLETAFFTGSPEYHNLILEIYRQERLLDNMELTKEQLEASSVQPSKWIEKEKMSNLIEEELNDEKYEDLVSRLTSLAAHPHSHMIENFLDKYRKQDQEYRRPVKLPVIDKDGYAHAVGRISCSSLVKRGTGDIDINKKELLSGCIIDT